MKVGVRIFRACYARETAFFLFVFKRKEFLGHGGRDQSDPRMDPIDFDIPAFRHSGLFRRYSDILAFRHSGIPACFVICMVLVSYSPQVIRGWLLRYRRNSWLAFHRVWESG